MYICIYVYMYICIFVYLYICIFVYMYICIFRDIFHPSAQRGCAHQRTVHFYGQLRLQPKKLLVFQTRTATKRGVYFTEHTQDATNQEIKAGPVAVLGRRKIIY